MVPRFTEFYIPVLQVMSDIVPMEINTLIDKVANHVNLSEEDRNVLTESGSQYRYRSNISWAVTDLSQGCFIERVKRGCYVITLSGLELLEENFEKIDRDVLASRSESFRAFMEKKGTRKGKNSVVNEPSSGEPIEEEVFEDSDELISEVSLEELYTTRETLVKAKISTYEIDIKIKELENESFFNTLLPRLYKVVPEALGKNGKKLTFTVEYIPGREISVKLGEVRRTKKYLSEIKDSIQNDSSSPKGGFENTKRNSIEVKQKNQDKYQSDKNLSVGQKTTESENRKTQGVWIEPYKDRMIVVKGDTNPFNDLFASYGGRFVNNPAEGWKGWIFMSNREEGLRKDLSEFLITAPVTNLLNSSSPNKDETTRYAYEINYTPQIAKYIELLTSLRSFNFLGITGPHKAVMLIAIFKGIRREIFKENKIPFSVELENLYDEMWGIYIGGKPTLGAVYPYVHLGREPFFSHRILKPITNFDKTWNRHSLERHIEYSVMDKKLVELVKDETTYNKFVERLINRYCLKKDKQDALQSKYQSEIINPKLIISAENLRVSFKNYLLTIPTKQGNLYSKGSVQVYINSLISDSMNEILSEFHSGYDIYDIKDFEVMSKIKQKVDELSLHNKALSTCRSALALYLKFIQTLSSHK